MEVRLKGYLKGATIMTVIVGIISFLTKPNLMPFQVGGLANGLFMIGLIYFLSFGGIPKLGSDRSIFYMVTLGLSCLIYGLISSQAMKSLDALATPTPEAVWFIYLLMGMMFGLVGALLKHAFDMDR